MSNAAETTRSKMIAIRMPLDLLQKLESLQKTGQMRTEIITSALRSVFGMPADSRILPSRAKGVRRGSIKHVGSVEVVEAQRAVEPSKPPSGDWWDRRQR